MDAMQELAKIYHKKGILILILGCNSPDQVNICLRSSTSSKKITIHCKWYKLPMKKQGDLFGAPSKMFTDEPVSADTDNRKSENFCISIFGTSNTQLYHH